MSPALSWRTRWIESSRKSRSYGNAAATAIDDDSGSPPSTPSPKPSETEPLAAADLWLLAWSAHLTGRDDDFARTMGRAYRAHLDAGEPLSAARCAGWLGTILDLGGEVGPGAGWLSRAQRLIEREGVDCPERGFLVLLAAFDHAEAGEYDAMLTAANQAFEIAERFGDLTSQPWPSSSRDERGSPAERPRQVWPCSMRPWSR